MKSPLVWFYCEKRDCLPQRLQRFLRESLLCMQPLMKWTIETSSTACTKSLPPSLPLVYLSPVFLITHWSTGVDVGSRRLSHCWRRTSVMVLVQCRQHPAYRGHKDLIWYREKGNGEKEREKKAMGKERVKQAGFLKLTLPDVTNVILTLPFPHFPEGRNDLGLTVSCCPRLMVAPTIILIHSGLRGFPSSKDRFAWSVVYKCLFHLTTFCRAEDRSKTEEEREQVSLCYYACMYSEATTLLLKPMNFS